MAQTSKKCSTCKAEKPHSEFYKDKRASDGLHSGCKMCHGKVTKRYAQEHPEIVRASTAKYRAKNPGAGRETWKAWRLANAQRMREHQVLYAQRHPDKIRELVVRSSAKRKAAKLCAVPSWTDLEEIKKIYNEFQRLNRNSDEKFHVDHIVPLISKVVCGLHVPANLQIIKARENMKKRNSYWPDMP